MFKSPKKYKKVIKVYVDNPLLSVGLAYRELFKVMTTFHFSGEGSYYRLDEKGFYHEEIIDVDEDEGDTEYDRWNKLRDDMFSTIKIVKKKREEKQQQIVKFSNEDRSFFGDVKFKLIDWFVKLLHYRNYVNLFSTVSSFGLLGAGYFSGLSNLVLLGGQVFTYGSIFTFIANILNDYLINHLDIGTVLNRNVLQNMVIDVIISFITMNYVRYRNIRGIHGVPAFEDMRDAGFFDIFRNIVRRFSSFINPVNFVAMQDNAIAAANPFNDRVIYNRFVNFVSRLGYANWFNDVVPGDDGSVLSLPSESEVNMQNEIRERGERMEQFLLNWRRNINERYGNINLYDVPEQDPY